MFDLDEYIGRALEGYGMVNEGKTKSEHGIEERLTKLRTELIREHLNLL
jgi:hypothetical protein